ncbi:hypothetical protein L1987_69083 [Smallanthus sonchifolius]|uniref:Uncharacterized protein n=1 Tax=Smallanthus sonchifolius TaxID=185202 RepID=A0ACB9B790_9ASTR|nr:hypothetical protein L1987_69083 [Smallanthus sonchifolius]
MGYERDLRKKEIKKSQLSREWSRGHASFSDKVTPLFNNMYIAECLELVKKVFTKRSKENELRKEEDMERERRAKWILRERKMGLPVDDAVFEEPNKKSTGFRKRVGEYLTGHVEKIVDREVD